MASCRHCILRIALHCGCELFFSTSVRLVAFHFSTPCFQWLISGDRWNSIKFISTVALVAQQACNGLGPTRKCNTICHQTFLLIILIEKFLRNSEVISLDRYCMDRGMELVPALDVDGDCKDPHLLQELVVTSQSCFPSTKYYLFLIYFENEVWKLCQLFRRLFHAGPSLTTLLVESNYELLNGSSDRTWMLCANSLREKTVVPNFNFGHILVEYGFQADYNFHEKTQSAWESSAALCFCAGTASWDWYAGSRSTLSDLLVTGLLAWQDILKLQQLTFFTLFKLL